MYSRRESIMKQGLRTAESNWSRVTPRHSATERRCNICNQKFHSRTVFDRYCATCKQESEIYRFGEWLPELDEALTEQLSA